MRVESSGCEGGEFRVTLESSGYEGREFRVRRWRVQGVRVENLG